MTGIKTIVITWTGNGIENHGRVYTALWTAEGDDSDLNRSLAYIAKQNRHGLGVDYRVHTFEPSDLNWKHKATQSHLLGCNA
jgi:hypothetical protein